MTSFSNWDNKMDPQTSGNLPLLGPAPVFRNSKDARLAAFGSSPDVQYPDGYLGTGQSNRRQDKILGAISRSNQRNYSRGVHKGERINPGDYIWPKDFNLLTGVMLESKGKKFAPVGYQQPHLTNDGKVGPRGVPRGLDRPQQQVIDERRRSMMKSLAPSWR